MFGYQVPVMRRPASSDRSSSSCVLASAKLFRRFVSAAPGFRFYLEKVKLYTDAGGMRMKPEVLETYVRDYIAAQPAPAVSFAWQGGEPTLIGVDFFRHAVTLQQRYANGKRTHDFLLYSKTGSSGLIAVAGSDRCDRQPVWVQRPWRQTERDARCSQAEGNGAPQTSSQPGPLVEQSG